MGTHVYLAGVYTGMTTLQNSLSLLNRSEDINTQLYNKIMHIYPKRIQVLYARTYTQNMHLGAVPTLFLILG